MQNPFQTKFKVMLTWKTIMERVGEVKKKEVLSKMELVAVGEQPSVLCQPHGTATNLKLIVHISQWVFCGTGIGQCSSGENVLMENVSMRYYCAVRSFVHINISWKFVFAAITQLYINPARVCVLQKKYITAVLLVHI